VADDGFRLPTSSYEELARIIRAYGREPREAGPPQIARTAGTPASEVSRNSGFLLGIGILEQGSARKKSLSDSGRDLAMAIEHQMPEEVARAWRSLIQSDEFLSRIVTAVDIRNGMERESLHAHIAFSAGQPRTPRTMTGARTVAAILENAGLIKEADGKYVPTDAQQKSVPEKGSASKAESQASSPGTVLSRWQTVTGSVSRSQPSGEGIGIHIQVQIQASPGDLPRLAAELRRFVDLLEEDRNAEADQALQGD
jgi:hypothetical protein